MDADRAEHWSRREFLGRLTGAATAGLVGLHAESAGAEPPPEVPRIRLQRTSAICFAPYYVAEELLGGEGFTDVQYVQSEPAAAVEADFGIVTAPQFVIRVDLGESIVGLAGLHIGCYELFGTGPVRAIRDLKGKKVAVPNIGGGPHVMLAGMLAYVGIDPRRDVEWVAYPAPEAMRLLAEGKVDAFMAFPPEPQELRAKKIGHVLVNTTTDRPWSQYFCCMVAVNRQFVRTYPVATKRALRAMLKANQVCAQEPERTARLLVDKGYASQYDYALQVVRELPYAKWREYDPADSVRFYALRLQEIGMIKSSPQKILAQGTDWRFLNELKKELKG